MDFMKDRSTVNRSSSPALTGARRPLYSGLPAGDSPFIAAAIGSMPSNRRSSGYCEMEEIELKNLERRVDELIATVERLRRENSSLRKNNDGLLAERARLIEKTEVARTRVEAMITRLKAMEQEG